MKDDTSTPTEGPAPNEFERGKPGTNARSDAEAAIEQLRQRGGVFVNAVRATRMPMALTDPNLPGNPIVFANSSFLKLSGYSMDEVLGQQPHFMNGPGTDPNDARRFEEAIRSDQDDIIETVQYRKDGGRFVATVLISAFKDDHGRTLNHFMSWLDVTRRVDAEDEVDELRRAQTALRASESKYRTLFESIDEGFCVVQVLFDAEGKPADYLFLEVNDVFERQTGPKDAAGKRMRELEPQHEQFWFDIYGEVALTGKARRFEQKAEALGRTYDVYAFRIGEPEERHVAILFNDIGERKRAEELIRAGEERQAFLLKLSDALRPLADAAAIQSATARLLGEYLGTDRSMYAEVEGEQGFETGTIRGQYVRRGELDAAPIEPFPDHFTFADFGGHTMAQRYRGEPLVVSDIDSAPGFEPEEREAWRAANVRAALVIELVKEGRLVAEFGVHCATAREWTDADISLMTDVAERTWAAAERARAEVAVRENERLRTAMLDVLPLGLGMMDSDGNVLLANPEWSRFIPTNRMPSRDPRRVGRWHSWDEKGEPVQPVNFPSARALRGESVVPPVEFLYEADDGKEIWTSVASVPLLDANGSVTGAVSVVQDVDTAKRAAEAVQASERHSKLLLAELQHRVRNTLAIVRSIAQRTAENSSSVDEMLGHFRGRLDAFSRVQAALTRSVGGTVSLVGLVEDELVAHAAREGQQVSLDGPDIELEPKTAERLSLAIHELTTNAVKHGALTNDHGKIHISWKRKQANGSARLLLNWKESGVEIEEKPKREGFGMELLLRSLPYDLQAKTKVALKRQGLEFHLDMPLRDPARVD